MCYVHVLTIDKAAINKDIDNEITWVQEVADPKQRHHVQAHIQGRLVHVGVFVSNYYQFLHARHA